MMGWRPGGRFFRSASCRLAQRGMVTLELAVGIVLAVVTAAALISFIQLGVMQAACAESAAQLARQRARGDEAAVSAARERAPADAEIDLVSEDGGVRAVVRAELSVLRVAPVIVEAQAWARLEPGLGP